MSAATGDAQLSFDDLGIPLHRVTFVVVDLETTGANPQSDAITEVAAVKVRGGEVLGEFATLVDPERSIPPQVVALTGITQAMVTDAPRLSSVLPSFLEFVGDAVVVAHNARFDLGFLRAACAHLELPWPKPAVVDTLRLARRVLGRDETPNHKLGTLAQVLTARTEPTHRALDDTRATVDVLHALLERLGPLGVHSLEDLLEHLPDVSSKQRRKRHLADDLPRAPGVYLFRGPNDEVLYVGTATNLHRRVRQYFTASEQRQRMKEMVTIAERVDHVVCAHGLEAEVRELRLLAAHAPRYNRRSKTPGRAWWITLTAERFPRLSVVRTARDGALGPFPSRQAAAEAVDALQDATPIRRCNDRIPRHGSRSSPCALAELGRCGAPCVGRQDPDDYDAAVSPIRDLIDGRGDQLLHRLRDELDSLSSEQRFEEAAQRRDRLAALGRAVDRAQRLAALAAVPELIAARPDGEHGWEFAVVRHGRLAAAGTAPRGVAPMPVVDALQSGAETVRPGAGPLRGGSADELGVVWRWLTTGGTRMVRCSQPWHEPAGAAGAWRSWRPGTD